MNTVSEIEGYYKKREQRLLKKLHQQEIALNAANQKLAQLIKNQKAQLDETTEQRAAHDQKLKENGNRDPQENRELQSLSEALRKEVAEGAGESALKRTVLAMDIVVPRAA